MKCPLIGIDLGTTNFPNVSTCGADTEVFVKEELWLIVAYMDREMNTKSGTSKDAAAKLVKNIRRKTRRLHATEEKIRNVLAGLSGNESIAALCRGEGISESLYCSWSKKFLEAGKQRPAGDTARHATSSEVKELRSESAALKEVVADLNLEKSLLGDGEYEE